MEKQALIEMLQSIRKDNMLGTTGSYPDIGDYIDFALNNDLIIRTFKGNFSITNKGIDMLEGKMSWEEL
jgi:hypothetical protein